MEEQKVKIGDLVKHKTDKGPTMTVGNKTPSGYQCNYWTENGFVAHLFQLEELRKVNTEITKG